MNDNGSTGLRTGGTLTVAVLLPSILGLGCLAPSGPSSGAAAASLGGSVQLTQDVVYRACRSDALFVEVPTNQPLPAPFRNGGGPNGWRTRVAQSLKQAAQSEGGQWFGGLAEFCPGGVLEAVHYNVLPQRAGVPGLPEMEEGPDRFHRFRFECVIQEGEHTIRRPLALVPDWQCDAVEKLRLAVEAETGIGVSDRLYYVGRECDASGSGLESNPTGAMQTWHYGTLGLSGPVQGEISGEGGTANLAQVDSGLPASLLAPLNALSGGDFVPPHGQAGFHRHGAAMADYARQIAPGVQLLAARAIDAAGLAPGEAIARALDALIFAATDTDVPLILNLSLGWPPQLARESGIAGPSSSPGVDWCRSYEDPFGESIRFVLGMGRLLDDRDLRRVFTVAAAGNVSGDPSSGPDPFPLVGVVTAPSATPPPLSGPCVDAAGPAFLPSGYASAETCLTDPNTGAKTQVHAAFGVSAIDYAFAPSALTIDGSETPLVAVGEHVVAGARLPANAVTCRGQFPPPLRLPASLAGCSIPTSFVSAAAARTQRTLVASGRIPFKWNALARFLYFTAVPLCRNTSDGLPVKRLDIGRMDYALEHCPWAETCARTAPGDPIASNSFNTYDCRMALRTCSALRSRCRPSKSRPPVEPLGAPICAGQLVQRTTTTPVAPTSCVGQACTVASTFDKYLAGGAGPQPILGGCPYCGLTVLDPLGPLSHLDMIFELNPDLPDLPGIHELRDPQLQLSALDGSGGAETVLIDLVHSGLTQAGDWVPGNTIVVSAPAHLGLTLGAVKDIKAELHVVAVGGSGDEDVVDVSPMVVELIFP